MFVSSILHILNRKLVKSVVEIRPIVYYTTFINNCSDEDESDIFKCYSDEPNDFSDVYKPLLEQDYKRFMSRRAARREPAITRQITSLSYKLKGKPTLSLAEGMPNEEVFPFDHVTMRYKDQGSIVLEGAELATALQYVPSQGLPSLVRELRAFQSELHRPAGLCARDVLVTNGAQHGIYSCCDLMLDEGDAILMSEYAYTGAHVALKPYQPEIISIPEDEDGIVPDTLETVLEERLLRGQKMPKLLYVVPTGNNPTGTVLPEGRRRKIYQLACQYDFLILEDDPYVFLNYTGRAVSSFLSLDLCGRVVRLDSLSKVVSAGARAGWLTAPLPLLRALELHMQAALLHTCTLAQTAVYHVIRDRAALRVRLQAARALYRRRRDALCGALAARAAPAAPPPRAGLFLWMRVPGLGDVYNMVFQTALERGLLLVPGHAFLYDTSAPSEYLRLTFSKIPEEDMDKAVRHLLDIIRHERNLVTLKRQVS